MLTALPRSPRLADWIERRRGVERGDILLSRRRIYILPTRTGLTFWLVVLVLLIGSINFSLQLGYLLTFTIVSMALVSMYYTHRNLLGLTIRGQAAEPVHAGDVASFELNVANPYSAERYALNFSFLLPMRRRRSAREREEPLPGTWTDLAPCATSRVAVGLPTRRRGRRACPRIRISTRFPFGLWEAWAYVRPDLSTVVYPSPESEAPPLPAAVIGYRESSGISPGGDEFAGVRPYRPGDAQKMIAWRLAARSDELSVKFFESTGAGDLLLDLDQTALLLGLEQRLARLARWVLMADAAGMNYQLQLPGVRLELGHGHEHCGRCLEALALYGADRDPHP